MFLHRVPVFAISAIPSSCRRTVVPSLPSEAEHLWLCDELSFKDLIILQGIIGSFKLFSYDALTHLVNGFFPVFTQSLRYRLIKDW